MATASSDTAADFLGYFLAAIGVQPGKASGKESWERICHVLLEVKCLTDLSLMH